MNFPFLTVLLLLSLPLTSARAEAAQGTSMDQSLRQEAERIDARLAELNEERWRHTPAITALLVAGGAGVGLGVTTVLWAMVMKANNQSEPFQDDDKRTLRRMTGAASVGLAAGIVGLAWLGKRKRVRRALLPEYRALQARKRELAPALRFELSPRSAGIVLEARF